MAKLRWPIDDFSRDKIDPYELKVAGDGDPAGLVAIIGDSRLKHFSNVEFVSFSPNGKLLASAGRDRSVRIWDVETGKQLHVLTGYVDAARCVVFSPDGNTLASCGSTTSTDPEAFEIRIWDIVSRKFKPSLKGHTKPVRRVSFNPNGKLLASASYDGTIRIWDLKARTSKVLSGHDGGAYDVAFHPTDSNVLVSGGADKSVRIWDLKTMKEKRSPLTGHTKHVVDVGFSRDGKHLASCGATKDNSIRIWKTNDWSLRHTLKGHTSGVSSASFAPNKPILASASAGGPIRLWNLDTGVEDKGKRKALTSNHLGRGAYSIDFNPTGTLLATANSDAGVGIWNSDTLEEQIDIVGHRARVTGFAMSFDGSVLASQGQDFSVISWSIEKTKLIRTLRNWPTMTPRGIQITPDGKVVVTPQAWTPESVTFYDSHTGEKTRPSFTRLNSSRCLLAPDGKTIAVMEIGSGRIHIRDVEIGTELQVLSHGKKTVHNLQFSPDGTRLVTGSWYDAEAIVWDIESKTTLKQIIPQEIREGTKHIRRVEFSPDSKWIFTQEDDGIIRRWNASSYALEQTITEAPGPFFLTPEGRHLIKSGGRGSFHVIRLDDFKPDGVAVVGNNNAELQQIAAKIAKGVPNDSGNRQVKRLREQLSALRLKYYGTPAAIEAAELMSKLRWLADDFKREDTDPYEWMIAGGGDAKNAPKDLVRIIGDSRLLHGSTVYTLEFSSDGQRLVSASNDKTAAIWDVETGRAVHILPHESHVIGAKFSPDDQFIATCELRDESVEHETVPADVTIWDAATGQVKTVLKGEHKNTVRRLAWTSDGRRIISVDYSWKGSKSRQHGKHAIVVWDVKTGTPLRKIEQKQGVLAVAIHPQGKIFATAGESNSVNLWKVEDGSAHAAPMTGHTKRPYDLAFSDDGKLLASAGEDSTIRIWNLETGKSTHVLKNVSYVDSVRFLNPSTIITAGSRGEVRRWDLADDGTSKFTRLYHDNEHIVVFRTVALDHARGLLAVSGTDNGIRLQTLKDGSEIRRNPIQNLKSHWAAISLDGSVIETVAPNRDLYTWAVQDAKFLQRIPGRKSLGPRGATISPKGDFVADPRTWGATPVRFFDSAQDRMWRPPFTSFQAIEAAISPNGELIAVGTRYPDRVLIRNLLTGQ